MCLYIFILCYVIAISAIHCFALDEIHKTNIVLVYQSHLEQHQQKRFPTHHKTCDHLYRTKFSSFVVLLLHKTSGNFLGLGSIIDRRTILTTSSVISTDIRNLHNILVLGGSLSPWWSRYSQVRRVRRAITNDYDLALLEVKNDWTFNDLVAPIYIQDHVYPELGKEFRGVRVVFGLPVDSFHRMGDRIEKSKVYYPSLENEVKKIEDCEEGYNGFTFNSTLHGCLYPNGTFCYGSMGSPVVGIDKQGHQILLGVVVRSECLEFEHKRIYVKIWYVMKWIRTNSLLGYKMDEA